MNTKTLSLRAQPCLRLAPGYRFTCHASQHIPLCDNLCRDSVPHTPQSPEWLKATQSCFPSWVPTSLKPQPRQERGVAFPQLCRLLPHQLQSRRGPSPNQGRWVRQQSFSALCEQA